MSFSLTTPQIQARTKTVTRRMGWGFLKAGDCLQAIEKGQGLKKGEKVKRLGTIRVVSVRREALSFVTNGECMLEGFPQMSAEDFISMFRAANNCDYYATVTRIEFEYV